MAKLSRKRGGRGAYLKWSGICKVYITEDVGGGGGRGEGEGCTYYSLVFVSIETVFHRLSNHLEFR